MKWEMEVAPTYLTTSTLFREDRRRRSNSTHEENKLFESALAFFDMDSSDRWLRIASMIPGKTVVDVMKHYQDLEDDVSDIEAGLVPIPGYRTSSPVRLEWVNNCGYDGLMRPSWAGPGGKKLLSTRPEQERKKGIPWTEEEHRLFLMGLIKYGKGDWMNISRKFVVTRTPTQVASHAQKYFIRQDSGCKDKRRSSIHDITTASLAEVKEPLSPIHQSPAHFMQPNVTYYRAKREDDHPQVRKLQQPCFLRGNDFELGAYNKIFQIPIAQHTRPSV